MAKQPAPVRKQAAAPAQEAPPAPATPKTPAPGDFYQVSQPIVRRFKVAGEDARVQVGSVVLNLPTLPEIEFKWSIEGPIYAQPWKSIHGLLIDALVGVFSKRVKVTTAEGKNLTAAAEYDSQEAALADLTVGQLTCPEDWDALTTWLALQKERQPGQHAAASKEYHALLEAASTKWPAAAKLPAAAKGKLLAYLTPPKKGMVPTESVVLQVLSRPLPAGQEVGQFAKGIALYRALAATHVDEYPLGAGLLEEILTRAEADFESAAEVEAVAL